MLDKIKRVAIYARVSTALQEKEKTINSQLEELRRFCRDNGFFIVNEYVDEGWSGETLARPALDQLRDDASKSLFEAVCFHSPDRLARKFIYQGLVIEELKKKGVEVIFFNKAISDSPEDQLLLGIQGLIAEYEKAKILERTRRGRLHKAKEKGIVGSIPPFGYDYVKKTPEREGYYKINQKEAKVVRLIFDLYLKLQSLRQVKKELYLRRIKTRSGKHVWADSTIQRVLTNEAYTGTGYYNKRQAVETETGRKYKRNPKTGRRLRDRKEWIPIKFPEIIEKEKFVLVQEILKKRFKPFGKSKVPYLFSGLIKCARCGYNFTGESRGTQNTAYYRCNNRHRKYPLPKTCDAKMIRKEELENAIWKSIVNAITNPKILTNHILGLAEKIETNKENLREEESKLNAERIILSKKKSRLIDLYIEKAIAKNHFLQKMKEYEQKEKQILTKIAEIKAKLNQAIDKPKILKHLEYFCNKMKERIYKLKQEQKQKFLRYLIEKIVLDPNKKEAKIIGHIPLENEKEAPFQPQSGTLSITCWNHGQYPNNFVKFELEVKV
jgi:site-specific DNA recombinase